MNYQYTQKVLFQHCDPAGIVFYPRYFEMLNACVESWFEQELACSFAKMHGELGKGIPTVTVNTETGRSVPWSEPLSKLLKNYMAENA